MLRTLVTMVLYAPGFRALSGGFLEGRNGRMRPCDHDTAKGR